VKFPTKLFKLPQPVWSCYNEETVCAVATSYRYGALPL